MARSDDTGAGLRALQQALAGGDMDVVATTLAQLDADSRNALEARLGTEPLKETYRHARRAPRGAPRGSVIVLNGIMGAQLDVVSGGTASRIWTNLFRLLRGDFQRLKLGAKGAPFDPAYQVKVAGIFPDYLPLLMSLKERWTVVPFAYDWRQDIARSAAELNTLILERNLPRPVHLVAHSMGGLVARTFVRTFRDTWQTLSSGRGNGAIGRLVMLGTPNKGSFAMPLVFTGQERMVRLLGFADLAHSLDATLDVVGSFPGCYQMLPSPLVEADDARAMLYERQTWTASHIRADYLKLGRAFHQSLDAVLDAERLVYVAGYGESTPYRIRIAPDKSFEYQSTENGDGRVPHELGLLPGVASYFVRESHGALPKNADVRDALDELFESGTTNGLPSSIPRERGIRRERGENAWVAAHLLDPETDERAIAAKYKAESRRAPNASDDRDHAQALVDEAHAMRGWTGSPADEQVESVRVRRGGARTRRARAMGGAPPDRTVTREPLLSVQVVWGDITLDEEGDVYVAGHYESVLPQAAEAALDSIVSAHFPPQAHDESDAAFAARKLSATEGRLIYGLTKRGAIRGSLGDVYFFPWADWTLDAPARVSWKEKEKRRLIAIAGMGYSGTFSAIELRRLARHLVFALQRLPGTKTLSSVLIGAGNGNLRVRPAVEAYVRGMLDGLEEQDTTARPMTLRIVESRLGKAIQIERELKALERQINSASGSTVFKRLDRAVTPRTMNFDDRDAYALALASASWRYSSAKDGDRDLSALDSAMQQVLKTAKATDNDAIQIRGSLKKLWDTVLDERRRAADGSPPDDAAYAADPASRALEALGTLDIGFESDTTAFDDATTRLGVVRERVASDGDASGNAARTTADAPAAAVATRVLTAVSALTKTAVIPKRPSNVDWGLIQEAIVRLTDPSPELVQRYGADLATYLLPRDFRDLLQRLEPLVFEVDRTTATVPWEMLCNPNEDKEEVEPLALRRHVARQLRTEYSPPPSLAPGRGRQLRILVVGDPGSPADGNSLPGARNEALSVVKILSDLRDLGANLEVKAMIGAPSVKDDSRLTRIDRASRFDVLSELRNGAYDVLHYCGHGDFDPQDPSRAGWVFEGGLLTSYELEALDIVPPLVVANACLSGLLSQRVSLGGSTMDGARDYNLVPSLADEFFRRGVHTYIGTAWYVNDVGAIEFARAFYRALLNPSDVRATGGENALCVDGTIGGAMHYARRVLKNHEFEFDALWAAYHHYGDPTQRISLDISPLGTVAALPTNKTAANAKAKSAAKLAIKTSAKTDGKTKAKAAAKANATAASKQKGRSAKRSRPAAKTRRRRS